jgi:hypothetical protein
MLYREIIPLCSEIHTKRINTPCGQNLGLLNVKEAVRTAQYTHYISPLTHSLSLLESHYFLFVLRSTQNT